MKQKYHHAQVGWNSRLDAVQAAILRVKLPYVDSWIDARQQAAQRYDDLINELHMSCFMERPVVRSPHRHVFNQYVVRVAPDQRHALVRHLQAERIGCDIYYPVPLHLQESLRCLGYDEGDFPASEQACQSVLALPMFPEITEDQQRRVIQACANFLRKRVRLAA